MDIENNLEDLKKQLKNAEVVYYKILGAVEALESIQEGEAQEPENKKTKFLKTKIPKIFKNPQNRKVRKQKIS